MERKNFRARLFWMMDRLKGDTIKKCVNEIETELRADENGRAQYIARRLAALIRHSQETTAYYSKLSHARLVKDSPVIDKTVIRSDIDSFISDKFSKSALASVVMSFKMSVDVDFGKEEQLKSEFISYLGSDANFHVEYVSEIPLLSSGKRKKIVSTYHNG